MKEVKNRFYEFEGFRIDAKERVLSKNGKTVPLTFKSFDVLLTLIQNSGRLLEKEELIQQVWAEAIVEEANLKNCISALRKALGDSPNQSRFIQTLPKLGYKFVAPVIALPENDAEIIVEKYTTAEIIIDESEELSITPQTPKSFEESINGQAIEPALAIDDEVNNLEKVSFKVDAQRQSASPSFVEKEFVTRKSNPYKKLVALAVMMFLLVIGAFGLYSWFKSDKAKSSFAFEKMRMARLTDLGTRALAMSSDGKYAVYGLNNAIWVKEFDRGKNTQLFTQNKITISKSEVIVLRKAQGLAQADCSACGKQVDMLTPEQAVTLIGISSLNIYRLVESRQLHFRETLQGHLLICMESLIANSYQLNLLQNQINGEG